MKSKKLLRTLAALCTALVLMGGFSVPAYAGGGGEPADETNDSNVQVEQPEETPPLTPDGNATLVDDYGGNKQLITVTTKNGNYFYILVDRDDEGENTVHFLNQVDEADLMALMEDENSEEPPRCLQLHREMSGRRNQPELPGLRLYHDKLHRQGGGTGGAACSGAGTGEKVRHESGCPAFGCGSVRRRGRALLLQVCEEQAENQRPGQSG